MISRVFIDVTVMLLMQLMLLPSVPYPYVSAYVNETFNYTGAMQIFNLSDNPSGFIQIEAKGASGGAYNSGGGQGGKIVATFPIRTGTILYIFVGQAGFSHGYPNAGANTFGGGGAGNYGGADGGGSSDVRTNASDLGSRLIVAGGGGGAGYYGIGGCGGDLDACNSGGGDTVTRTELSANGASQTRGGYSLYKNFSTLATGTNGTYGQGGRAVCLPTYSNCGSGGGGGGGWYQGKGGVGDAGGSGGSSYCDKKGTIWLNTKGANVGHGTITITTVVNLTASPSSAPSTPTTAKPTAPTKVPTFIPTIPTFGRPTAAPSVPVKRFCNNETGIDNVCLRASQLFTPANNYFYAELNIISSCCSCPLNAVPFVSGNQVSCQCELSRYHGNFNRSFYTLGDLNLTCKICPKQGVDFCSPNLDTVIAVPGFYIIQTDNGPDTIECQPKEACNDGICTKHYTGIGCTSCNNMNVKHYRLKDKCVECPNWGALFIILGALGLPLLLGLFLKDSAHRTYGISILLSYIQIVTWKVKLMLPFIMTLILLCLFALLQISRLRRFYIRFLLTPWKSLLIGCVKKCCKRDLSAMFKREGINCNKAATGTEQNLEANVGNQLIYAFVSFITLSYTFLAKTSTQPFNLVNVGENTIVLRADASVTVQQRDEHMGLVWFFFFIYAVGIPITLFSILLWAYKKNKLLSKVIILRFGVLFTAFRPQYWFWGPVLMSSKFLSVLILDMVQDREGKSTPAQINLMFINLTMFMVLQEFVRPYVFTWNNRVVFVWLVTSVAVVTAARFFLTNLGPRESLAYSIGVILFVVASVFVSVQGLHLELRRSKENIFHIGDSLEVTNMETSQLMSIFGLDAKQASRVHRKLVRLKPALRKQIFLTLVTTGTPSLHEHQLEMVSMQEVADSVQPS